MVGFGIDGYSYGMMGYGGMVFGLLFWIVIIVLAYFLINPSLRRTKLAV